MGADHPIAVVEELVPHDDDVMNVTVGVDDPMPGGEGTGGAADLVERGGDLAVVVGMLVRQHEVGGRVHVSGFVAVHPLDLRRPLPAFIGEIEPKPTDTLGFSPCQRVLDGRLPLEVGQLIGHIVQINPASLYPGIAVQDHCHSDSRMAGASEGSGGPEGSHLRAPSEPGVTVCRHPAPIILVVSGVVIWLQWANSRGLYATAQAQT